MSRRWILAAAAAALVTWAAVDLWVPRRTSLRSFQPREVASIETDMWRSYYERRPVALFFQMSRLMREQYGFRWLRSQVAAFHTSRSAFVFKRGANRQDYEKALPDLRSFYDAIRRDADISFDPTEAARRELEWWILHRERDRYGTPALATALAELPAGIYQMPAASFAEHGATRAEGMVVRDQKAAAGGVTEADWQRIHALLDQSWTSLHTVVNVR